jgi:hypothetical protein
MPKEWDLGITHQFLAFLCPLSLLLFALSLPCRQGAMAMPPLMWGMINIYLLLLRKV